MNTTYNLYITNVISFKKLFRFGEFSNDHHLPGFFLWYELGVTPPKKDGKSRKNILVIPGHSALCLGLDQAAR